MRCASRVPAVWICAGALAAALLMGAGCRRSSSGGGATGSTALAFSLDFFPIALGASPAGADVAFDASGDLLAVADGDSLFRISQQDGSIEATGCGAGAALRSVVASGGRTLLGAADGSLFEIQEDGGCEELDAVDLGSGAVTGLAIAPAGFGDFGGFLVAVREGMDVVAVDLDGDPPVTEELCGGDCTGAVDLVFSGGSLLVLLPGSLVRVDAAPGADPVVTTDFATGFSNAVGVGLDAVGGVLLVADAGVGALIGVSPTDGEIVEDLAPYDFGGGTPLVPSGIAGDGRGTLVLATAGSAVLRAVRTPPLPGSLPIDAAATGYGDLELDGNGDYLLLDNRDRFEGGVRTLLDSFLYRVGRFGSFLETLAQGPRVEDELQTLLSLARDPVTEDLYLGTAEGWILRRSSDGALETLPSTPLPGSILGLELDVDGVLFASTDGGEVLRVDPEDPDAFAIASLPETGEAPDLVFDEEGALYVLQRGETVSRIWRREPGDLGVPFDDFASAEELPTTGASLGLPQGVAFDAGGRRLLIVTERPEDSPDQLLEVDLADDPGAVRALVDLAEFALDEGFFPSGLVYDGLGRAAFHGVEDGISRITVTDVPLPE